MLWQQPALLRNTKLPAAEIARQALAIAAEICIYTNDRIVGRIVNVDEESWGKCLPRSLLHGKLSKSWIDM